MLKLNQQIGDKIMKIFKRKKDKIEEEKLRDKTQKFVEKFANEEMDNPSLDVEEIMNRLRKNFNSTELEFLATQFVIKATIDLLDEDMKELERKDKDMMYR